VDELATFHVTPFEVRPVSRRQILGATAGRFPAGLHTCQQGSGAQVGVDLGERGANLGDAFLGALGLNFGRSFATVGVAF